MYSHIYKQQIPCPVSASKKIHSLLALNTMPSPISSSCEEQPFLSTLYGLEMNSQDALSPHFHQLVSLFQISLPPLVSRLVSLPQLSFPSVVSHVPSPPPPLVPSFLSFLFSLAAPLPFLTLPCLFSVSFSPSHPCLPRSTRAARRPHSRGFN